MSDAEHDSDHNRTAGEDDYETDSDEPINGKITLKAKKIRRSNGKWKLYYDKRSFKKEWLELFPWVEEDPDDSKFAICRACNKKIKAHKGILETHQKTKRHLRNLSGSDDLDEHNKSEKLDNKAAGSSVNMDQVDDQISFFAETPVDAAHQAITSIIDKLVEKYHEKRLENLKAQNEAMLQLNVERAKLLRIENQRKLELQLQQQAFSREAQETHLKLMQMQHETKINAMEDERDAKLRAVEQKLMFAKQEYEKKVRYLDVQLSCIK